MVTWRKDLGEINITKERTSTLDLHNAANICNDLGDGMHLSLD
jgi:hypothetical protein